MPVLSVGLPSLQNNLLDIMTASRRNFLIWASWLSLVLPLVSFVICSEVSTGHLIFHHPLYGHNVGPLRYYAFLLTAIFGLLVLLADLGSKRWWLLWLPLASFGLTWWLYQAALDFTGFLD